MGGNVKFHPLATKTERIHPHFRNVNKFNYCSSHFHTPQRVFLLMRCSAAFKHGKLYKDLKKFFLSHLKDFAVWQKLAEIFIVHFHFTARMTQPSSVTTFRALQDSPTHTGKTRQCVKKNQNFELRNGMTYRGCASQKCSDHICTKSFDFFAEHAGKIPSISPFYP